jgi:uncharacterized phage protein (TIGR02220 family)
MPQIRLDLDELAKLPFKELDVLKALVKLYAGQPMNKVTKDLNLDTQIAQSIAGFLVNNGGRQRLPLLFCETSAEIADEKFADLVLEVRNEMNRLLGTDYKIHEVSKHIRKWYDKGFVEIIDYTSVVATMAEGWRDEPKLRMHLRPATLFGDKFEQYRNIARIHSMPVDRVKFDDEFTGI